MNDYHGFGNTNAPRVTRQWGRDLDKNVRSLTNGGHKDLLNNPIRPMGEQTSFASSRWNALKDPELVIESFHADPRIGGFRQDFHPNYNCQLTFFGKRLGSLTVYDPPKIDDKIDPKYLPVCYEGVNLVTTTIAASNPEKIKRDLYYFHKNKEGVDRLVTNLVAKNEELKFRQLLRNKRFLKSIGL